VRDGQRAAQVDAQHEVPQPRVGLDEEGEEIGASVVDEHVDRSERLADLGDGRVYRRGVCDVHQHGLPIELGSDSAASLLIQVRDRHASALGRQAASGGGTDSGGATCDERDLALKTHGAQPIRAGRKQASRIDGFDTQPPHRPLSGTAARRSTGR